MEQADIEWSTCATEDCIGIPVSNGERCLAHCSGSELEAALNVISETSEIDARGVTFSSTLLEQVLAAVPRVGGGRPTIRLCRFVQAVFNNASFHGIRFSDGARFSGATFDGVAGFNGARFDSTAEFDGATFDGVAGFDGAMFDSTAEFNGATFGGVAGFNGARFDSIAGFNGATFGGDARFDRATFSGAAGFNGARFSGAARFGATFRSVAWFDDAMFDGVAGFHGATFEGDARFNGARFSGDTRFNAAMFEGDACFNGARFSDDTRFHRARFSGDIGFDGARFSGDARFDGVTFSSAARFDRVTFSSAARFDRVTFSSAARFDRVTFSGDAEFSGVVFRRSGVFGGTKFEQAFSFGPVLAYHDLVLDGAEFARRVRIEAGAAVLSCRRTRFPAGVEFRLRCAQVVLDDVDFSVPSTLSGISHFSDEKLASREKLLVKAWLRFAVLVWQEEAQQKAAEAARRLLIRKFPGRPHLLSLRGTNVAGLALNSVTLDDCRFTGAHNLDKLRLEDGVGLSVAPTRLRRFTWDRRVVIAEESAWRAGRSSHWTATWWSDWIDGKPDLLEPGQIALLYRALRKGREDSKDEPGAADFYYGEMEMRRHARRTGNSVGGSSRGWAERALLTAYWLVSGYGLRAWRALAWLAVAVVGFALLFHWFGFRPSTRPDSYWESLLYTFRTTLSLTDREFTLTSWGKLFQALLRITGPVFLGLAALAFRGRVKR